MFPLIEDKEVYQYIWECFDQHKMAMSIARQSLIPILFREYYTHLDDTDSGVMLLAHGGPASEHVKKVGADVGEAFLPMSYLKS